MRPSALTIPAGMVRPRNQSINLRIGAGWACADGTKPRWLASPASCTADARHVVPIKAAAAKAPVFQALILCSCVRYCCLPGRRLFMAQKLPDMHRHGQQGVGAVPGVDPLLRQRAPRVELAKAVDGSEDLIVLGLRLLLDDAAEGGHTQVGGALRRQVTDGVPEGERALAVAV